MTLDTLGQTFTQRYFYMYTAMRPGRKSKEQLYSLERGKLTGQIKLNLI